MGQRGNGGEPGRAGRAAPENARAPILQAGISPGLLGWFLGRFLGRSLDNPHVLSNPCRQKHGNRSVRAPYEPRESRARPTGARTRRAAAGRSPEKTSGRSPSDQGGDFPQQAADAPSFPRQQTRGGHPLAEPARTSVRPCVRARRRDFTRPATRRSRGTPRNRPLGGPSCRWGPFVRPGRGHPTVGEPGRRERDSPGRRPCRRD